MTTLCIVVPTYKQFSILNANEITSWSQCLKVLNTYTIYLVCPQGLIVSGYIEEFERHNIRYEVEWFTPAAFASIQGYNKLMLSKDFFRRFSAYDYLLTYQLDAYIFRDDLAQWCALDYSYIGAPWFEGYMPQGNNAKLWKVGNGGFTLRKISSCLQVLNTFKPIWSWSKLIKWYFRYGRRRGLSNSLSLVASLVFGNNTYSLLNDFYRLQEQFQEDYFWGIVCSEKFAWYRVPTPELALKFSFEVAPSILYELNNRQLPTGCHAWNEYDPLFWKSFIFKDNIYK